MQTKIEQVERSLRRTRAGLIIMAIIIFGKDFLYRIAPMNDIPIGYIGAVVLIFLMIRFLLLTQKMKQNPELVELMNDEYAQHLILKSYRISYFVLMTLIVLLLISNAFFPLSAVGVMKIILIAVASMPHIVFWILDREA